MCELHCDGFGVRIGIGDGEGALGLRFSSTLSPV